MIADKKVTAQAFAGRAANWQICENYTIIEWWFWAMGSLQIFNEFITSIRLKNVGDQGYP
jgi:hypothetical protein